MKERLCLIGVCLATVFAHPHEALPQGALSPSGAPAPDFKTLDQIEPRIPISSLPFTNTVPGAYYLTTNLAGVSGANGITIAADNVSIDMMGFVLQGVPGSFSGISTFGTRRSLSVANGFVTSWGQDGVSLYAGGTARDILLSHISVISNANRGIVLGDNAVVRDCAAYTNGDVGIVVGNNSVVESCVARGNVSNGIQVANGSVAEKCSGYNNGGDGINVNGGSIVVGNCAAYQNFNCGINVAGNANVHDCSSSFNKFDGIRVQYHSVIRNNTCAGNGFSADGAGIRVLLGNQNRIEGNHCLNNDWGVRSDSAQNIIIGNTCTGNTTNFVLVAGNRYGQIINLVGGSTAAISGNSSTNAVVTTNPWANFAY